MSVNGDFVVKNATLLTMDPARPESFCGTVEVCDGKIAAVYTGAGQADLGVQSIDAGGCVVTPGLIDCHTHAVYAGNRNDEFVRRLCGISYAEIARLGGGIMSTVRATRKATMQELVAGATKRIRGMMRTGTVRVEIKSGYGLDKETELTMLRAVRAAGEALPVHVHPTFLGAHVVPPEYAGRADEYLTFLIDEVLPVVAGEALAEAVDGFCEHMAFTPAQLQRLADAAQQHGLRVRMHAEQLSNRGGAVAAARAGAVCVDHLEYLPPEDCDVLARTGTIAVLLPGAFYFLKECQCPPVKALRAAGVPVALATDCNPGSSPFTSLPLMMNMGCIFFGLTVHEAFAAVTVNAARALGVHEHAGMIRPGMAAGMVIWNVTDAAEIVYAPDMCHANTLIVNGKVTGFPVRTPSVASGA